MSVTENICSLLVLTALLATASPSYDNVRCTPMQWESTLIGKITEKVQENWISVGFYGKYSVDYSSGKQSFIENVFQDDKLVASAHVITSPVSICSLVCRRTKLNISNSLIVKLVS